MTESKSPELRIYCNHGWRELILCLLGLSAPLWAIIGPACLVFFLANGRSTDIFGSYTVFAHFGQINAFFFPWLLLLSLTLRNAHMVLRPDKIRFPGATISALKLANITSVKAHAGYLLFSIKRDGGSKAEKEPYPTSTKSLALSRMSVKDRSNLLRFLKEHAKNCTISEEARVLLSGPGDITELNGDAVLELTYNSNARLTDFKQVVLHYAQSFWLIWTVIWSSFSVLVFAWIAAYNAYGPPAELIKSITRFLYSCWCWVGSLLVQSLDRAPGSESASIGLACLLILYALYFICKPDRLILDSEGAALINKFMNRKRKNQFIWKQCKSVELCCSKEQISRQILQFKSQDGKILMRLDPSGMKEECLRQLRMAVETWAPWADLDPGFVESFSPAAKHGYTALWLQSLNAPPQRDRLVPLKSGDQLLDGKYRILSIIGSGGQGIAYLAEKQPSEGKAETVVVKEFMLPVFVERTARRQALEKFENESEVLDSLAHKQIVKIQDHFIEDHRAYLVLEHIRGKSLRKLVEHGSFKSSEVIDLAKQMCEILIHLHSLSPPLVHRDFTPDNLILDESDVLKLIDFTLASQGSTGGKTTIAGRHAYMPPEQFAGKSCPQSDIYAMGATVYFLFFGKDPQPFSQSCAMDEPADSPPELYRLISACTALPCAERPESASAVLAMLSDIESAPVKVKVTAGKREAETIELQQAGQNLDRNHATRQRDGEE